MLLQHSKKPWKRGGPVAASGHDPCGVPSLGAVLLGPGLCSQVDSAASAPSSPREALCLSAVRAVCHHCGEPGLWGRLPLTSAGAEIGRCAREGGLCLPPGHPVAPRVGSSAHPRCERAARRWPAQSGEQTLLSCVKANRL